MMLREFTAAMAAILAGSLLAGCAGIILSAAVAVAILAAPFVAVWRIARGTAP